MKKYSFLFILLIISYSATAQSRMNIAGFPQFNQYLNPALTGYDGTSVQGFYRNQLTTFDKAPQTFLISGEINLSNPSQEASIGQVNHSLGLATVYEDFGATTTSGLNLSYAASVKITKALNFRAGLAVTYDNVKTKTETLTPGEMNDPAYQALKNNNTLNKYGLNAGIAVASENFYAGYAAYDAVKQGNGNEAYFNDTYVLQHAVQAGYRHPFTNGFGLVANGRYRYDEYQKGVGEGQLKAVFMNTAWLGGGYRQDIGTILTAGVRVGQFKIGYSRELNTHRVIGERMGANEIVLSYHFAPIVQKAGKQLSIW